MSLRKTAHVAFKPASPNGDQKVDFSGRKSATKFLYGKTFSGKAVRHSLAYLTMHK